MKIKESILVFSLLSATLAHAQLSDLSSVKTPAATITAVEKTPKITSNPMTSENVTVKNVSIINGTKDDFSPMFYENGILFCSNSRKVKKGADESKMPEDLNLKYAAFDTATGGLKKPSSFGHRTNSKTHEGPACFSHAGDTMFLTRNMSKGGVDKKSKNGLYTLKIYLKIRDTVGNFIGDKLMPFELESYSYCHPTLSRDGKRLYFSSNMPGGFGGMDLYVIRKINDSTWTPPINLGARINTSKNELFPNISENGTLYFASNGQRKNVGGLDIYQIDIENRTAKVTSLGKPFNTEGDDFGFMLLPGHEDKGFFSSNRKGGSGGDDIYEFEMKE